ncbi:MAG TPA: hypothetical protein VK921_08100 [Anditalea sp.]|nr:hypothetical protein [Anditalea sp.]
MRYNSRNNHFEIERSIGNVDEWVKVGELEGVGWSVDITNYNFGDITFHTKGGNIYYRLRQVDFNLEYEYSKTVKMSVPDIKFNPVWKPYPNPLYEGDILRIFKNLPFDFTNEIQIRVISSQSTLSEYSAISLVEIKWGCRADYIKIFKKQLPNC